MENKFLEVVSIDEMMSELSINNFYNLNSILKENGYEGLCFSGTDYVDISFIKENIISKLKDANQYGKVKIKINNILIDNSQRLFNEEIKFHNFIFEYGFYFDEIFGKSFKKNISFEECKFSKDVIFKYCIFGKDLIFDNCEFEGKLEIRNCDIKNLTLSRINRLKNLLLVGGKISTILFEEFDTIQNESSYFIYGIKNCNSFTYKTSFNISNNFVLGNFSVECLYLSELNLGKTTFNGIKINKLFLENTTLNDCIFNGVEFTNYELEKIYDNSAGLSNKQLKDNYRQLKFVMDKNGNYTEGNKFYEKEMEYYLKSLNIEKKGFFGTFKELFDGNFLGEKAKKKGEEIVLLFGWNINEFGNNWLRSLQAIILVALFSVIIDGISTFLGMEYGNFLGDFIIIFLFFIFIFLFGKYNFDKSLDIFLEKHKNVDYYLMISLFIGILVFYFLPNFDPLKVFGNLLNPLYLKEKGVSYNGIEILGLTLYKTIYGILFWHLVIALKRTTKR